MTQPATWSSTLALVLALMGTVSWAQVPTRRLTSQHVTLSSSTAGPPVRVALAPGVSTLLLFDSAIDKDALKLEGRETRVRVLDAGERSLLLEPRVELAPGERLLLLVPFQDARAPAHASFALVSEPAEVNERVTVVRQPRASEDCPGALEASGPGALILSRQLDEAGVQASRAAIVPRPGPPSSPRVVEEAGVTGFRAPRWAAVSLTVLNLPGQAPWKPGGARLTSQKTRASLELRSVRMEPSQLGPGESGLVVVETGALPEEAGVLFTLELWDTGGERPLSLPGVRFPTSRDTRAAPPPR